ncbi:MAG: hypothetical protein LBR83_07940 [Clostridiales bacterium]|jgi:hypothetical protein|nr:hypothetical protein [Clostridiales bacterium]
MLKAILAFLLSLLLSTGAAAGNPGNIPVNPSEEIVDEVPGDGVVPIMPLCDLPVGVRY